MITKRAEIFTTAKNMVLNSRISIYHALAATVLPVPDAKFPFVRCVKKKW
jgi:hypothetical protein